MRQVAAVSLCSFRSLSTQRTLLKTPVEFQHFRLRVLELEKTTGGGAYWAGRAVARSLFAANGQAM